MSKNQAKIVYLQYQNVNRTLLHQCRSQRFLSFYVMVRGSKRSYCKSMGGRWKSYGAIKSRLKQADTKLSTAHRTILQEDKALKESPGEYDPGSDLQTEADRIKSARADIDEALRMIKDCK